MEQLAQAVDYLNLVLFTLVALAAAWQWRAGRGRAGLWAALTFGVLALVVNANRVLPEEPSNDLESLLRRLLIAVLALFPYLLYRFTAAFRPPPRGLERLAGLMTVVVVGWTFLIPEIPDEGEPRPASFIAFLVAFLVHWTVLSVIAAVRLWRAGRGEPNVARRRMQMLSVAATAITVALFIAAANPGDRAAVDLVTGLVATAAALAFLVGLAPPRVLRYIWRRPEQARLQETVAELIASTTEREVADKVLPPMTRIFGARGVALRSDDGRILGTYGVSEDDIAAARDLPPSDPEPNAEVLCLAIPSGSLLVWPGAYAPYFGRDELNLLRALAGLTGLALDRARLFAHEKEARLSLERADELKTQFVALAAHELRTPIASVHGIVETLNVRGDALSAEQRAKLEAALQQQAERMRVLVDQLLDLSRLDAEAVDIHPEPVPVRDRVEELVRAAAGEKADDVEIAVPPELEVAVDPAAFDRIVSNLVVNAFRYGAPPVVVEAERRDRHFRLAVEDHGRGVPSEFVPQPFDRFTRSEHSTRDAGGTGLGLAIARAYARAHGGELVYARAEPGGARFELVLPTAPENGR